MVQKEETHSEKKSNLIKPYEDLMYRYEVYSLETISGQNNFLLYDKIKNILYKEISLIKIFDIIFDKEPIKLFNLYFGESNLEQDLMTIKKTIIDNQKEVFRALRTFVQLTKINIFGMTYQPIEKRVIEKKNKLFFNMNDYKNNLKPTKKKKYSFPNIEKLLRNILQEGYEKFLIQMAHKIQNPLEIIPCHWLIQDKGGTGKTDILADRVLKTLFPTIPISQQHITSDFNSYLLNIAYLIIEEVEGYEDEKKIKLLTGAKTHTINQKYSQSFEIENFITVIITSNDLKSLKLSIEDRRFNVVGGGKRLQPITEGNWENTLFKSEEENKNFFKSFHDNFNSEIQDLFSQLFYMQYDKQILYVPLKTKLKDELIEINHSSEMVFLTELKELGIFGFIQEYFPNNFSYIAKEIIKVKDNIQYIPNQSLFDMYKVFCKKSNYKEMNKNNFFKRIIDIKEFSSIFGDQIIIKIENKTYRVRQYLLQKELTEF